MLALRFSREANGFFNRWALIRHRLILMLLLLLILQGLIVTNLFGIRLGVIWYRDKLRAKYALQTIEIQPDDALKALYSSPQQVREYARFSQEQRLTAFGESLNLLLLVRLGDPAPASEILPD